MRLWHYELIPFLPRGQLVAQKRECDLIFKDIYNDKKTNHILINYIWDYEDVVFRLVIYYELLELEFHKRGYFFKHQCYYGIPYNKVNEYNIFDMKNPFPNQHNYRYLLQCFHNLQEKYDRGQKDFDDKQYQELEKFVRTYLRKLQE